MRRSVDLSSALWKNGGSDPDAVWYRRSDGSRDEACSAVWGSVHGKGYFGGDLGRAIVTKGDFTAYVCNSAATRPSSQITLGNLLLLLLLANVSTVCRSANVRLPTAAPTRVVSLEISGGKFPEIYSNLSGNLLITCVNQQFPSPALQSDAVN